MKLRKLVWALGFAAAPLAAQDAREIALDNADFEQVGEPGRLPGWNGTGNPATGYRFVHAGRDAEAGVRFARLESVEADEAAPFGNLFQMVDPEGLRGRRIRLTARVRLAEGASEHLGLWLRVDRPGNTLGFFDNMRDRPIRSREWAEYTIEGDVAPDATRIMIGVLMTGKGAAEIDTVRLADIGAAQGTPPPVQAARPRFGPPRESAIEGDVAPAPVTPRGIDNLAAFARLYGLVRWFHPTDAAAEADWDRVAIAAIPRIEAATSPGELAAILEDVLRPYAPELVVTQSPPPELVPLSPLSGEVYSWKHTGLGGTGRAYTSERERIPASERRPQIAEDLPVSDGYPGGVWFRLPLTAAIRSDSGAPPAPVWNRPEGWTPAGFDRTTRLAATISAWAMLQHFYPYWDTVDVDWDAELRERLDDAAMAADDRAFALVLERLVEPISDGHGGVFYGNRFRHGLPLDWQWVEERLVVTAAGENAAGIAPGMVVTAIDGVPVTQVLAREMAQVSGSPQHKRRAALSRLRWAAEPGTRALDLVDARGLATKIELSMVPGREANAVAAKRPAIVDEIEPGIVYVDLTRWTDEVFAENLVRLTEARGIVFDLRGYPRGSVEWLTHLIDGTARSPAFQRPVFTEPDAAATYPVDGGWSLEPAEPRIGAKAVFLTDARAISYSESILGTVRGNSLGPIIGSPTAGANGNRSDFAVAGGYGVPFTGMRVTARDGRLQHIQGVPVDLHIEPTLAGIRAGTDEVLEAGLAELKRLITD